MPPSRDPTLQGSTWLAARVTTPGARAAVALGLVAVAFLCRGLLNPVLGEGYGFITFFPAVALAGAFGGRVAAVLALAVATPLAWWFFVPPARSFEITSAREGVGLLLFVTSAGLAGWIAGLMKSAGEELVRSARELRESEDHYRHTVELNPQAPWTARPDGQLDHVSRRWHEWTGTTGLGESWAGALHPDDVERTFEVWRRSVATGEPYDIEHRARLRTGEHHWMRSRAFPRRDAEGRIVKWYGTTEDIHERKEADQHLLLMVNELNHRVKNNLATVQALAMQTLRGEDVPKAREAFLARLLALSSAHDVLTREQWEGAPLAEIARGVLDPLCGDEGRLNLGGPPVTLTSRAALSIAMALHELCTNAMKYGALSAPGGRVGLNWSVADAGSGATLRLTWFESGGPEVREPDARGFGSRLLERGVASELRGTVHLSFPPEGLVCEIEAPLSEIGEAAD